ncbi:MAG: sigma-54-dependent Fis family transcriptional regulator [Nitrospirae bacterium]|nr:sigma-54-dependent Fis family transcriptional regulator [Nitrospirota bacterium]
MANILIVEDEEILRRSLKKALQKEGYAVSEASNFSDAEGLIKTSVYDIAVFDINIPDGNGISLLKLIKEKEPETEVIMMTAYGSIQTAVSAMKEGAYDYLTKPLDIEELRIAAKRALESAKREREIQYFRSKNDAANGWDAFIGNSSKINEIRAQAERLGSVEKMDNTPPPPVFITGETGTGKGYLARLIHHNSQRKNASLIEINCTAIPDNMVESELFGFEKGAFTDAKQTKRGLFEVADGGTLFLDEIGHMPLHAQAKLLKCVEDNEIRRLGSTVPVKINVRIIAATNRDLEDAVEKGEFRKDLYHRLKVFHLHLPPIREREADVLLLGRWLLGHHALKYGIKVKGFSKEAEEMLMRRKWHGNIRELSNEIEKAVFLEAGDVIALNHLMDDIGIDRLQPVSNGLPSVSLPEDGFSLEDMEVNLISQALQINNGNIAKTARYLRISRDTLRYRIEKYNLLDK